jgi:hypothetical protein
MSTKKSREEHWCRSMRCSTPTFANCPRSSRVDFSGYPDCRTCDAPPTRDFAPRRGFSGSATRRDSHGAGRKSYGARRRRRGAGRRRYGARRRSYGARRRRCGAGRKRYRAGRRRYGTERRIRVVATVVGSRWLHLPECPTPPSARPTSYSSKS